MPLFLQVAATGDCHYLMAARRHYHRYTFYHNNDGRMENDLCISRPPSSTGFRGKVQCCSDGEVTIVRAQHYCDTYAFLVVDGTVIVQ